MENKNLYELLNSSIQSSQRNRVNFSSLYALLKAILQQLDGLKGTGVQAAEDGVSEVAPPHHKSAVTVERCCHRVDALEGTLRSLKDSLQKSPEFAELYQSVTWDLIQPERLQEEVQNSSLADPSSSLKPSQTPTAPGSSLKSEKLPHEDSDVQPAADATSPSSGRRPQSSPVTGQMSTSPPMSPESCNEMEISPRTFSKLMQRDTHTQNMTDQLKQQGALIDRLMSDREKLDTLEGMIMNTTSSGEASESLDADGKAYHELKQQISHIRRSVQRLEDDMKQLKAQQGLHEERASDQQLQLQDQECVNFTLEDPSAPLKPSHTPAAPGSVSGMIPKAGVCAQPAAGASFTSSGSQQQSRPKADQAPAASSIPPNANASESSVESTLSPRTVSKLMERFSKLETLVASLKEGKVDQSQLKQLREIINKRVDTSRNVTDQLKQQGALIDRLMSDREKLDALEEMIMSSSSSGEVSGSVDADGKAYHELKQQITLVRKSVQRLEDHIKQLKAQQAQQALSEKSPSDQQPQEQDLELVNDLQKAILQLQAECEKLNETTKCLQEENIQKQNFIQELYKTTEELEERKAGKEMLESVMKSDKSSLDSKVSHVQFDSVIEELNALFQELLNKVSGQEQVIERLSSETECKLNRMEFDPVKKQLEERWGWINKKLQDQTAPPECDDAAALKKQLMDTFHCLSCDRPIIKNFSGPNSMEPLSYSYPPPNKSEWQFTVNSQDRRSKYFSEQRDYSYPPVSRSCGGKSTLTTRPMLFSERKKMRDLRARARKSLLQ